jgi:FkbM family methyltransferase
MAHKRMTLDEEFASCIPAHPYLQHLESGLFVKSRGDVGVIRDQQDEYGLLERFDHTGSMALDLGGNIGAFVWYALIHLKAKEVVSVEPDPACIDIFSANWQSDKRVRLIEAAVTQQKDKETTLYLGRTYTGTNSLRPTRGRRTVQVKTVSLNELVQKYQPNLIKCDIEGSECDLDWNSATLDCVRYIIAELHMDKPEMIERHKIMDHVLIGNGFTHAHAPDYSKARNYMRPNCIAFWKRV